MDRPARGCFPGSGFLDCVHVEVSVSTVKVLLHGSSYHGKSQSLLSLDSSPTTQSLGSLCFAAGILQVQ